MGRPAIYPWSAWFEMLAEGEELDLVHGVDFYCPVRSMRGGVINEAKRRGVRVKTTTALAGKVLSVRQELRCRYPWDRWLDGKTHYLVWDRDFLVTIEDMRKIARAAAKRRGLYLRTAVSGDQLALKATPTRKAAEPSAYDTAKARLDSNTLES